MSRTQRRAANRRLEKAKQRREREKQQKKNAPSNFKNIIKKVIRSPKNK